MKGLDYLDSESAKIVNFSQHVEHNRIKFSMNYNLSYCFRCYSLLVFINVTSHVNRSRNRASSRCPRGTLCPQTLALT
jgi:hypothetical protein